MAVWCPKRVHPVRSEQASKSSAGLVLDLDRFRQGDSRFRSQNRADPDALVGGGRGKRARRLIQLGYDCQQKAHPAVSIARSPAKL